MKYTQNSQNTAF